MSSHKIVNRKSAVLKFTRLLFGHCYSRKIMAKFKSSTPIKFESNVENPRIKVVVYAKNYSSTIHSKNDNIVIWYVLEADKNSDMEYSHQLSIGSEFQSSGLTVKNGPFPLKHGSTWKITFQKREDVAILEEGECIILQLIELLA